jgi:hypothetical protein
LDELVPKAAAIALLVDPSNPRAKIRLDDWETYAELLRLARAVRKDLPDLHPHDMIDIQSFLWVQGSDEYPDRG